jgi:hypothetical protein
MASDSDTPNASQLGINGSSLSSALMDVLMAPDIQPGSDPSYQTCKTIYTSHPLGGKMVDAPIKMAQSQKREITVQDAPDEVIEAFEQEWEKIGADGHIRNVKRLSRIYGIAALIMGCKDLPSEQPLEMTKLWELPIFFNALDPLNTAGSLVLNQVPTAADFNKPVNVTVNGQTYHRSRYQVVMNEEPIYLEYTNSAFGFVGRSVYQRALFPLKSFIRSMIADDMVVTKLGLLVAKQKTPGSVVNNVMQRIAGVKRSLLKQAQTGQVMQIDVEESVETLDMQNVDGAGTFARTNIIKNVATAADMPAKILDNETLVEGFGEGTEDAKLIAGYIDSIRLEMAPEYAWFDNIVQYRAWNPAFYERIQSKYPELYGEVAYEDAFSQWRQDFAAAWPSLLREPPSEKVKVEQTKLEAITAFAQTLLPEVDPANKARVIQWAADNMSENKLMFPHELQLDYDELEQFQSEEQERQEEARKNALNGPAQEEGGVEKVGPEAKKFGRFDSSGGRTLPKLRRGRSAA